MLERVEMTNSRIQCFWVWVEQTLPTLIIAADGRLQLKKGEFDANAMRIHSKLTVRMVDDENKSQSQDRAEAQPLKSSTDLDVKSQRGTNNFAIKQLPKKKNNLLSIIEKKS